MQTRKFFARCAAAMVLALVTVSAGATGAVADDDAATAPLAKWVGAAAGGYDVSQPVRLYPGSSDVVRVPTAYTTPEREFRSSWVATVNGLNVRVSQSEADFQGQYDAILDRFEQNGLNAVIFQVRPALDAWYPSEINPWSAFLSGAQGRDPGYDPLAWMVEQTHARGLQYHAWFNPYRVTASPITSAATLTALGLTRADALALHPADAVAALAAAGLLSGDNYAVQHPDQVLSFNGSLFLDPGEPDAQRHVSDSVLEVAERYDIDGVHFDDYFYPYRVGTSHFGDAGEDRATFEQFGIPAGYADDAAGIVQWRRDNVTTLMADVSARLDGLNDERGTAVQFGVSPFGIWEHASIDPRGSNTPASSSSTYSTSVFADTRQWVKDELIDYIVPQLYWSFDLAAAPYGELARWWNDTVEGTNVRLYIGHANYKHLQNGATEVAWTNPDEIPNQLLFDQRLGNVSGEVFFGYADTVPSATQGLTGAALVSTEAKNAAIQRIFGEFFAQRVLPPAVGSRADRALEPPTGVSVTDAALSWSDGSAPATRAFAVYRDGDLHRVVYAEPGAADYRLDLPTGGAWAVLALDHAGNASALVPAEAPAQLPAPAPAPPPGTITDGAPAARASASAPVGSARAGTGALATTGGTDATPVIWFAVGLLALGTAATIAAARRARRRRA